MKESLDAFQINATEAYALIADADLENNSAIWMRKMKAANAKLQAIKVQGLPEALKEALDGARVSMRELFSLFKCESETPEAFMAVMQEMGDDLDLLEKMMDFCEASGAALFRLKVVASKYGIELQSVSREQLMASFDAQSG